MRVHTKCRVAARVFGFDRTQSISLQPAQSIADAAQRFGQENDITVLTLTFAPANESNHSHSHCLPNRPVLP
jgi:hypothetical protein